MKTYKIWLAALALAVSAVGCESTNPVGPSGPSHHWPGGGGAPDIPEVPDSSEVPDSLEAEPCTTERYRFNPSALTVDSGSISAVSIRGGYSQVSFSSSDASVAEVVSYLSSVSNMWIKGHKPGTASITVVGRDNGGECAPITGKIHVTVQPAAP